MQREPARSPFATLVLAVMALMGLLASGCTPGVGSACTFSTDCGTTGTLVCDTSEFQGYCTVEDCVPDECPTNSACVLFNPQVPGCGYNDRAQGSRIADQFCMATCGSNSDCRDGYECADPTLAPWRAEILDNLDNRGVKVCIPMPLEGTDGGGASLIEPDAAVCQVEGPPFDAHFDAPDDAFDAMIDGEAEESGTDAADSGD
jgi:hypothetical protein